MSDRPRPVRPIQVALETTEPTSFGHGFISGLLSAILGIVLAIIATSIGLFSRTMSWRPSAVVLVILLAMLALY